MSLLSLFVFLFGIASIGEVLAVPVTYDQQQTGDLNVRVDLKDIQIVALLDSGILGNYGEYDYAYDYSDFTIKPITPQATTSKLDASSMSTTSVKPWNTWPTVAGPSSSSVATVEGQDEATVSSSSAEELGSENKEPKKNASSSSKDETRIKNDKNQDDLAVEKNASVASSSEENNPQSANSDAASIDQSVSNASRKCSPGYASDQKGRCNRVHVRRRVPSSLIPFGIRLVPRVHRHEDHLRSKTVEN